MSPDNPDASSVEQLPLKALGLRSGMALQTRRLVEGASKKESQFFGAIEGKGVMVGPLGSEGEDTGLDEGEVCVVRGFTGQYEFSFVSKVLQTFQRPFAYALLAYPRHIDARLVRQSIRVRSAWPTKVLLAGKAGVEAQAIDVRLIDLSMQGAMISASSALAGIGDSLVLHIAVRMDDSEIALQLTGTVCHNNRSAKDGNYFIGLAFRNLSQNDKLALNFATQKPTK